MATTSLRQVAGALRPVGISAVPLGPASARYGSTRHLGLFVASLRWRKHNHVFARTPSTKLWQSRSIQQTRGLSSSVRPPAARLEPSRALSSPIRPFPHSQLRPGPRTQPAPLTAAPRYASTQQQTPSAPPKPTDLLRKPLKSLKTLTPHENIYTVPNALTFSRLLCAPLIGYLILSPAYPPSWSLALFAYAGLTDLLDGFLARRLNQHTVVGSVIDPMADKSLMAICTVSLGLSGLLPWWAATIIVGRDVGLAISAIWWRWISLPPPKTMARYWDFSLPSAEVYPTEISKINTLLQLLLIGNAMLLPVLPAAWVEAGNLQGVFEGWCGLVAGTTVWSGLSYVGNKDAVKIVSQEEVRRVLEEREAKAKVLEDEGREEQERK